MGGIVILGVFVADTAYRAARQPRMGETLLGQSFALGPGGKGSNQAVACGRLGAEVAFITRLGQDPFAEMARQTWGAAGVTPVVTEDADSYTGAAFIFVDAASGDNAIIIAPGAAARIGPEDIEAEAARLGAANVFVTQLEQPLPAALRALELARAGGATTILNPAPAAPLPAGMLGFCDWVTPNEAEAETLTGIAVADEAGAKRAAERLVADGAGGVVVTLGARGAYLHTPAMSEVIPAFTAGPVVETTGAGDAFNGGFATALAGGAAPRDAVRFGCATAAISVTRAGAAASMPTAAEVAALLAAP